MADLALGGLERTIKACLAIKKAVETVQQNKKGCRDVEKNVDIVTALLSGLKEMGAMMHHTSFTAPLDGLAESLEEALQLVTDCQHKNALRHLLGAGDMAKQLRRVQEDIQRKQITVIFAISICNLGFSVSVTNTLHYVGFHPPRLQPQVTGEVNYDSSLSVIEMRPGVNNNTTMVATGEAEQYAYSSEGLMEFNSSKWESSLHLSSEEIISEGGHLYAFQQRVVIKLGLPSDRSRVKAMMVASKVAGISSVAITGDGKDRVEVRGVGVDCVGLIIALRKKVCAADIVMVEGAKKSGHRRNGKLPARQRSIHPSEASSSSSPAHHVAAQPWQYQNAAATESQDVGQSPRDRMAYLRDAAAYLREWVEPVVPMHGILFVLAFFLLFLGFELLRGRFNPQ